MKDIYELLNRLELDAEEFEEAETDEVETARVKARLKQSIRQQHPRRRTKRIVATAVIVGFSTLAAGFSFPQAASQLPVIGNLFTLFDEEKTGFYDDYEVHSTPLNLVEESNGIKVMLNNAIFDGKTATVTFTVQSEHDLGDHPLTNQFDIKGVHALAGSSEIKKVNTHEYRGMMTGSALEGENLDIADITWDVGSFTIYNGESSDEIKGDWQFAFKLAAPDRKTKIVDQVSSQDGVEVAVEKVISTPYGFTIFYSESIEGIKPNSVSSSVDLIVKDDLGNIYPSQGNGGYGTDLAHMNWSTTFSKLDPNATRIIVTPELDIKSFSESKLADFNIKNSKVILEDMVIEVEK
jgi:hypothetical protein